MQVGGIFGSHLVNNVSTDNGKTKFFSEILPNISWSGSFKRSEGVGIGVTRRDEEDRIKVRCLRMSDG